MPPRRNPLKLNPLQRKTLAIFQELARHPETSTHDDDNGEVLITQFPQPHGNHYHIGDALVSARDMTGITNESVWLALERKGLARSSFPIAVILTAAGLTYDTAIAEKILLRGEH